MTVREIVASVLGVPAEAVGAESSPREFPQWDSAAHIDIVLSVEAEYGVRFGAEEMAAGLSVGALEKLVREKGAAPA